jgi:hypothetical protein
VYKKFGAESPIIEWEWLKYVGKKNLSDEKIIEWVIYSMNKKSVL